MTDRQEALVKVLDHIGQQVRDGNIEQAELRIDLAADDQGVAKGEYRVVTLAVSLREPEEFDAGLAVMGAPDTYEESEVA